MENMESLELVTTATAEAASSVLDKAVTNRDVAYVVGGVVSAVVVYKLARWAYKKVTAPAPVAVVEVHVPKAEPVATPVATPV